MTGYGTPEDDENGTPPADGQYVPPPPPAWGQTPPGPGDPFGFAAPPMPGTPPHDATVSEQQAYLPPTPPPAPAPPAWQPPPTPGPPPPFVPQGQGYPQPGFPPAPQGFQPPSPDPQTPPPGGPLQATPPPGQSQPQSPQGFPPPPQGQSPQGFTPPPQGQPPQGFAPLAQGQVPPGFPPPAQGQVPQGFTPPPQGQPPQGFAPPAHGQPPQAFAPPVQGQPPQGYVPPAPSPGAPQGFPPVPPPPAQPPVQPIPGWFQGNPPPAQSGMPAPAGQGFAPPPPAPPFSSPDTGVLPQGYEASPQSFPPPPDDPAWQEQPQAAALTAQPPVTETPPAALTQQAPPQPPSFGTAGPGASAPPAFVPQPAPPAFVPEPEPPAVATPPADDAIAPTQAEPAPTEAKPEATPSDEPTAQPGETTPVEAMPGETASVTAEPDEAASDEAEPVEAESRPGVARPDDDPTATRLDTPTLPEDSEEAPATGGQPDAPAETAPPDPFVASVQGPFNSAPTMTDADWAAANASSPAPETQAPRTPAPETPASETSASETSPGDAPTVADGGQGAGVPGWPQPGAAPTFVEGQFGPPRPEAQAQAQTAPAFGGGPGQASFGPGPFSGMPTPPRPDTPMPTPPRPETPMPTPPRPDAPTFDATRLDAPRLDAPATNGRPKSRRKRAILIGVGAGVALGALVGAGVVVLSGSGGTKTGDKVPPAQLAAQVFPPDPAATRQGRDQRLTDVAALQSTVVAVGSESDTLGTRAQFLVSTDGGRTFHAAASHSTTGAAAAFGDTPRFVAGGTAGWVAIGSQAGSPSVWTSKDGTDWTKQPSNAGAAFGAHDRIWRLTSTASGFIAVGDTSSKGDFSDARPVVWLSPDGRQWQRIADSQLPMTVPSGYLSLPEVVANGNSVIVHAFGATPGGTPGSIDSVWASSDGGHSWQKSATPAETPISFGITLGATSGGFLLARTAVSGKQRKGQVLQSSDGMQWKQIGEIDLPGYQAMLRLTGSGSGLVATVQGSGGKLLLARSADGRSWQAAGQASGSLAQTAATASTTILVGDQQADGFDSDALDLFDAQGNSVPLDLRGVPGAKPADQIVNALAAGTTAGSTAGGSAGTGTGTGRQVAVGSSNGDAAIWTSADGRQWTRAQTGLPAPGQRRLLGAVSGPAGWLAVGYGNKAQTQPLVEYSPDGTAWHPDTVFHPDGLSLFGATVGPDGYVIVGDAGNSAETWHSTDLKNWSRGSSAAQGDLEGGATSAHWMHAVVGGQFGYVAAGGYNDPSAPPGSAQRPAVWTSSDAKTWALQRLPIPAGSTQASLHQLAAKGNTIVATGTAAISTGWTVFAEISADGGRTWRQSTLPEPGPNAIVTALTVTPKGWVVAGSSGPYGQAAVILWTSTDTRTWTAEHPEGAGLSGNSDNWLTAMTPVGGDLLATGVTADYQGERPTIWRRPLP